MKIVEWSPDGTLLAVGGSLPSARIISSLDGKVLSSLPQVSTRSMSWSPGGQYLAVAVSSPVSITDQLRIWDIKQGRWHYTGAPRGGASYVAWSHDGKTLAVTNGELNSNGTVTDGGVSFYDTSDWQVKAAYPSAQGVGALAWSPDDKQLAFTTNPISTGQSSVAILDTVDFSRLSSADTKPIQQIDTGDTVSLRIAWSPKKDMLAAAFPNGTVQIYDPTTGQQKASIKHGESNVNSVAWSPDGNYLASGGDDDTVKIWNASTWQQLKVLDHSNTVDSVDWSADGTLLAVACETDEIWIWNAK